MLSRLAYLLCCRSIQLLVLLVRGDAAKHGRPNPCTRPGASMRLYPSRPEPAAPAAPTRVYPCSLTDAEWAVLAPLVQRPASPQGGRPPKHPLRQIIDAIRYLVHSGCAWRLLPQEFPPRARCTGGLPKWT